MNHVKLLDCTLRDGAYLIDKRFGDEVIRGIIDGLVQTGIDFIEVGFLQNEGFGPGKTVYRNSADARRFVPGDKQGCEFTVLADYSRYDVANLDLCTGDSIDAVRECFFKAERHDALRACADIKEKGYKLFVQPVDILGYSDREILEFIDDLNRIEPYCLSIVDTFGSMYQEDLQRVFELIDHNLVPSCRVGFHSHNNMQLSSSLSQDFVRMTLGKRECVVDGTVNGMGRGAGNTPTELIAQYLVSRHGYPYDMNALLDLIDAYMDNIRARCKWGYSTEMFLAGCYSAHVNNIAYLTGKSSIRSKDIGLVLNKIGSEKRKRYDYDLLERTYLEVLESDVDDSGDLERLRGAIGGSPVVVLVPGSTARSEEREISELVSREGSVVISVNFLHDSIPSDFVFMSNARRYRYWSEFASFSAARKILTSNLDATLGTDDFCVSALKLMKCGWDHMDNSTLMLLRLLDNLGVDDVSVAGFDGYDYAKGEAANYVSESLELSSPAENPVELNKEISEMLASFWSGRKTRSMKLRFVTPSRFSGCIGGSND